MSEAHHWNAEWLGYSQHPEGELGFFEFEANFELESEPEELLVKVSADQRFTLLVNGAVAARGPQRGDELHWHYELVDIRPHLRTGSNTLRAEVTNFGRLAPMAQHTVRLGFILEAEPPFEFLSTPGQWRVRKRLDRSFAMMHDGIGEYYIDVGPGEILDKTKPEGIFVAPHKICRAESRGQPGGGSPWNLTPPSMPPFADATPILPKRAFLRRGADLKQVKCTECEVSAGWELLLDFEVLTCGYPTVWLTSEESTELRITYCESLWDGDSKGNRDQIQLKSARGYEDRVIIGEEGYASFNPSWWRTFRYVSIRSQAPVGFKLGFGFQVAPVGRELKVQAHFSGQDPVIEPVWDICIRTLRLCADETYFDCPYYEQLQYLGDTRLQALIGYYLSADRFRQRNAIDQFHWSTMENGLTQSRYPSRQAQVIPPFSLWWVVMLYDAWMHDPEFDPRPYVSSAERVIDAYANLIESGETNCFWNFGDWIPEWKWGIPPGGPRAEMHLILHGLASWSLGQILGRRVELRRPVREASQPMTEHAESLWRYWQLLAGQRPDLWTRDQDLVPCTYFWQFYKHEAIGPSDYLSELGCWNDMVELGLTTTPETPEPTRSDCHGWSAHPALGYFLHVAGIRSCGPGWSRCSIAPKPGRLTEFAAEIPHPSGQIRVSLIDGLFTIDCPVPFDWRLGDHAMPCAAGKYEFHAESLEGQ